MHRSNLIATTPLRRNRRTVPVASLAHALVQKSQRKGRKNCPRPECLQISPMLTKSVRADTAAILHSFEPVCVSIEEYYVFNFAVADFKSWRRTSEIPAGKELRASFRDYGEAGIEGRNCPQHQSGMGMLIVAMRPGDRHDGV